jgi:hypothetical protein
MIAIFAAAEKLGVMLAYCLPDDHQAVAVALKARIRTWKPNLLRSTPRRRTATGWLTYRIGRDVDLVKVRRASSAPLSQLGEN